MIRTLVSGAIAAAGVAGLAQPAAAAENYYPQTAFKPVYKQTPYAKGETRVVRTADLNLENDVGAAALERRLRTAASQVCGGSYGRMTLAYRSAHRACVRETLENALAQVNEPRVLARFDDITHRNTFSTAAIETPWAR
jgi:UrcA family protein